MPYIKKTDSTKKSPDIAGRAPGFAHLLLRELGRRARCAGDLNFIFSQIAADYVTMARGPGGRPCGYEELSDVEKALAGALMEFRRRVLWPYEDRKIAQACDPSFKPEMNRPIDPFYSVAAYGRGEVRSPEFLQHDGEPLLPA